MTRAFRQGNCVEWNWGPGTGRGRISEIFRENVTRTIKGKRITRRASVGEPAYLIEQDDGDRVLKSHSELRKV